MHGLSRIVNILVRADLPLGPVPIHVVEGFKDNQGLPGKGAAIEGKEDFCRAASFFWCKCDFCRNRLAVKKQFCTGFLIHQHTL